MAVVGRSLRRRRADVWTMGCMLFQWERAEYYDGGLFEEWSWDLAE